MENMLFYLRRVNIDESIPYVVPQNSGNQYNKPKSKPKNFNQGRKNNSEIKNERVKAMFEAKAQRSVLPQGQPMFFQSPNEANFEYPDEEQQPFMNININNNNQNQVNL